MKQSTTVRGGSRKKSFKNLWLPRIFWGVAAIFFTVMVILVLRRAEVVFANPTPPPTQSSTTSPSSIPPASGTEATLPGYEMGVKVDAVARAADLHTIIPSRPRVTGTRYKVEKGDSVFSIANKYKLKPETVLWANYDLLNDNPNMLSIDQNLLIPPTDGVYYKWQKGDTLDKIAGQFKATTDEILTYVGNKIDLTNPEIKVGTYVMIPGGWREFKQWLVPTIWRPNSGASRNINGCVLEAGGAYGTGFFTWPTGNRFLSGNDYWSGHLGIDIAAAEGTPLYAADSGQVVYASAIGGGYGNMIMIDHGNGYHTLYAHLSSILVKCGQSVSKGSVIGYTGNTGNSTGPHLHFEVRYNGGYINPWYVLP